MPVNQELLKSLKCNIRVGTTPNMDPAQRHGSVWFEISGLGEQRRDFIVNHPERLVDNVQKLGMKVAQQLMLLDPSLPKHLPACKPMKIDITIGDIRRLYALENHRLLLEQKLR